MTPAPFPLGFGCMQFGGRADAVASRAMFDACLDAGIRHFDTAWVYTNGASETLLGQMAQGQDIEIATKIGYSGGAGRANLQSQFDESRRRLGDCAIDLLYLHRFDPETPLHDSLALLAEWQRAGVISRLGLSNFAAWQVMKAQAICAALGTRIDAIQPMYSLLKRQAEVEILPMAADQGITTYPYSPLGGGLLSGKYALGATGRITEDPRYAARYGADHMTITAQDLAVYAADLGTHPATLAVAWIMAHPSRPRPLISARDAVQLAPSLAAAQYVLSPQTYARLATLSPSPPPATDRTEEI